MGARKLRTIFGQYMVIAVIGVLLILVLNLLLYGICIKVGAIIPTKQIEQEVATATEKLKLLKAFREDDIPFYCDYALFSQSGVFQKGTIDVNSANSLWLVAKKGGNIVKPYRIAVINCENKILLLRYRITAQFRNDALRGAFVAADLVFVAEMLIVIILYLFLVSYWFEKFLGKKIDKLLTVTEKIERQDLDFKIESSGLAEINRAMEALDHMRQALKESLAQQWKTEKLRQNQISALTHDLKSPLTIIQGNMELLCDTILSDEQTECVQYITSGADQLQRYIKALLDLTGVTQDYTLKKEKMSTAIFLEEIKISVKGLCAAKNIQLEWKESCCNNQICVDFEQMLRAIINIVSNAIEHSPENGSILFVIHDSNPFFQMSIIDTGGGFSPQVIKHATEQFYMGDESRNSKVHYGIGLYSTNEIVNYHSGQLILENDKEVNGAKVTIKIPYFLG